MYFPFVLEQNLINKDLCRVWKILENLKFFDFVAFFTV